MARDISISFALTAALKGGFKAAFQGAAAQARNVSSAIRAMEKSPVGKLGAAMAAQREKIKGLAGSLKDAKGTLAALQAQAQASGGATGILARQIAQAERRVNNLSGALTRQLGQWKSATAEAATAAGSVRRLSQDYDNLSRRMERARRTAAALGANQARADALRSQRSDLNSRLAGTMATAATVAAPAKLSIDFEDSVAKVGAVANASDEDLARLTQTARQLGRDTSYSASQAAEGMKYLAMAGFDANETIAAMPGMLDLAAAGSTDLGTTADIASDILSAFKLKAEEMGQVSDTLAKTFTTSNTSLEMLGETMKYVGPVAASVGMSLQDTSAMAGMLGNVGIKASQAGTVLRAALLRLSAPPKMAKEALGELAGVGGAELDELYEQIGDVGDAQTALQNLGMTTKDAAGNLRPMADILEELNMRTAHMGTAEKAEVFKNVFGTEASAGMIALAEQASVTVDKYGNKIIDAWGRPTNALRAYMDKVNNYGGTASQIAQRMNATTGGALRRLSSAWEDAGIEIGNLFLPAIQAAAGALSGIANVISGAVQRFPTLSKGVALAVAGLALFTVTSLGLGLVVNTVRTGINSFAGIFLRLSASQITATGSTGALSGASAFFGGIARVAARSASSFAAGVRSISISSALAALKTGAMSVAMGIFGVSSKLAGIGARFFAGGLRSILIASGVGALLVALGFGVSLLIDNWDSVVEAMSSAWNWVKDTWSRLGVFFTELGKNLSAIFPEVWDDICGLASSAKDSVLSIWNGVTGFFSGLWDSIVSGVSTFGTGIISAVAWAKSGVTAIWNGITTYYAGLWNMVISGVSILGNGIASAFAWARDSALMVWEGVTSFFYGVWDGITSSAYAVAGGIIGVFGNTCSEVMAIWDGALSFFDYIGDSIMGVFSWARDSVLVVWTGLGEFFTGIGMGISETLGGAWQYVSDLATWAFEGVAAVWTGALEFFGGIVDGIWGVFTGLFAWLQEKFSWVFSTIDAVSSIIGKVTGAVIGAWNKAFGEDGEKKPAAAVESSSKQPVAKAGTAAAKVPVGQNATAAQKNVEAKPPPARFTPVSRKDVEGDVLPPKKSRGGKSSGKSSGYSSGGSSGGRSSGRSAISGQTPSDSGPVTIVSLAGDNSKPQTLFIPAGGNASPNAVRAAAGQSGSVAAGMASHQTGRIPAALPQSPELIGSANRNKKAKDDAPASISVDLKQQFDLITSDAAAVRKIMESIKPDMEALVRRALEKLQSDKRRTAYAQ